MASRTLVREEHHADPPPARPSRAGAVRSGLVVAALGVLTTLPFYLIIAHLQSQGRSAAAIGMSSMPMSDMSVYWAFPVLQASGIAALIWAYVGVFLGLLESGGRIRGNPLSRAATDRLHRQISLLVLGLILVHALATALDAMGDGFVSAFVPWQQSWGAAVFAYNIGIFALYLAVLLGPTYYVRRRIGQVRWRLLHRLALVVYILSVWHTLLLGLDFSYYPWVRPLTWLAQVPLLLLFARRMLRPARRPRNTALAGALRYGFAGLAVAASVAITALVVTGHSGWPARVGHHPAMPLPTGNPLLPVWLRVLATAAFAAVLVIHLRHLLHGGPRARMWHGAHVLMALGMIDMFLPTHGMLVGGFAAEAVFAVAAVAVAGLLVADLARTGRVGALWLVAAVDLAAMAYMFAAMDGGVPWLTWLLVAWFVLQGIGWATGRLADTLDSGGLGGTAEARVDGWSESTAAHGLSIRLTLLIMNVGMAYMFVALSLGGMSMPPMPGMPAVPSMPGMPGM